ncbi:lytic polysaccharide monooxygenase [Acerihabitans sp.]|uniref:lytic polysaccharide monooxygenase n=1 Tax=Acerihabitans sp. TaxID=2811394 RepID=UPI002ED8AEC3
MNKNYTPKYYLPRVNPNDNDPREYCNCCDWQDRYSLSLYWEQSNNIRYNNSGCYINSTGDDTPVPPLPIVSPASRAQTLVDLGRLHPMQINIATGGKNFPDRNGGPVFPPFQDDVWSATPPLDDFILSGGQGGEISTVNLTDNQIAILTLFAIRQWPRLRLSAGQLLNVEWLYDRPRLTRGYRAFITRDGWNPNARITRAQLEPFPFWQDINQAIPYWRYPAALQPKTHHAISIPFNKRGHHVIVLLWLIADFEDAVYQAFDIEIDSNIVY